MRADMDVWLQFLKDFNGIFFWRTELLLEDDLQVFSDAAGSHGFGVYFHGH